MCLTYSKFLAAESWFISTSPAKHEDAFASPFHLREAVLVAKGSHPAPASLKNNAQPAFLFKNLITKY